MYSCLTFPKRALKLRDIPCFSLGNIAFDPLARALVCVCVSNLFCSIVVMNMNSEPRMTGFES